MVIISRREFGPVAAPETKRGVLSLERLPLLQLGQIDLQPVLLRRRQTQITPQMVVKEIQLPPRQPARLLARVRWPVSYTHLTLPTKA